MFHYAFCYTMPSTCAYDDAVGSPRIAFEKHLIRRHACKLNAVSTFYFFNDAISGRHCLYCLSKQELRLLRRGAIMSAV